MMPCPHLLPLSRFSFLPKKGYEKSKPAIKNQHFIFGQVRSLRTNNYDFSQPFIIDLYKKTICQNISHPNDVKLWKSGYCFLSL